MVVIKMVCVVSMVVLFLMCQKKKRDMNVPVFLLGCQRLVV